MSSAGDFQDEEEGWKFVVPEPDVITCFPGDMLQFITRGALMSTPHKVELADRVRYAIAYFHEPSFGAVLQRTNEEGGEMETVHYVSSNALAPTMISENSLTLSSNLFLF